MARAKYIIHKAGTPRLQRGKYGGIAPAGLWWDGTCWGDSQNAQVWETDNTCSMPVHNGEWVEIYVNEDIEGDN